MDLQERGWRAWALAGDTQLVLPLGGIGTGKEAKRKSRRRGIN